MKLCAHTKDNIILWSGCYCLLCFHASLYFDFKTLLFRTLLTPLGPAIGFGLFKYFYESENPKSIDDIVINFFGEHRYDAIMTVYKLLPVASTLYVIVMAQIQNSYEDHVGWIIFMLIYTGGEIGLYLKYAQYPDED